MKAAALVAILVVGAAFLFGATSLPVSALDSNAETGFKKGVQGVGGEGAQGLEPTIKNVINTLLFIAGISAVVIIVISGLRFVTSEGDSNSTNRAKDTIIFASIGLVVSVLAYTLINFVLDQLG